MKVLKIIALVAVIACAVAGIMLAMYKFTDIVHSPLATVRKNIKKRGGYAGFDEDVVLPMPGIE